MSRRPFHSRSRPSTRDASSRISAADIARALGGIRSGKGFVALCPAHDDRTPSLSVADSADSANGKVLVHCHAGCSQQVVIAALIKLGLWHNNGLMSQPLAKRVRSDSSAPALDDDAKRERALEIWSAARPAEGTLVEAYLRNRGITIPLPPSIRFHERLRHQPSGSAWPAMVALITDAKTNEPIAIHRTFLELDGKGKAPIEPSKMMLAQAKGGVIRLADAVEELMVGEGIETCLSVMQACGTPTWSALSVSGLKSLNLPPGITRLSIFADGDDAGERAAQAAAQRLRLTVRTVRIVRAPPGEDFNDLLRTESFKETTNE